MEKFLNCYDDAIGGEAVFFSVITKSCGLIKRIAEGCLLCKKQMRNYSHMLKNCFFENLFGKLQRLKFNE